MTLLIKDLILNVILVLRKIFTSPDRDKTLYTKGGKSIRGNIEKILMNFRINIFNSSAVNGTSLNTKPNLSAISLLHLHPQIELMQ